MLLTVEKVRKKSTETTQCFFNFYKLNLRYIIFVGLSNRVKATTKITHATRPPINVAFEPDHNDKTRSISSLGLSSAPSGNIRVIADITYASRLIPNNRKRMYQHQNHLCRINTATTRGKSIPDTPMIISCSFVNAATLHITNGIGNISIWTTSAPIMWAAKACPASCKNG